METQQPTAVGRTRLAEVWVVLHPETVVLTVENTGDKLTPHVVSTLVEPFQRGTERIHTHHTGVGLGPAIVKSIAQAHAGTLTLTPAPPAVSASQCNSPRGRRCRPERRAISGPPDPQKILPTCDFHRRSERSKSGAAGNRTRTMPLAGVLIRVLPGKTHHCESRSIPLFRADCAQMCPPRVIRLRRIFRRGMARTALPGGGSV
ncbi:sensor histidine kinase [Nocardia sp. NPDC052566]|uniref:sensor histidine kinase n=1 Tax=Nocardia sp. NPDC052566 TaxID=3364330 RepID=UPI0037C92AFC